MMIPFDYLVEKFKIQSQGVLHVGASTGQERDDYNRHGITKQIWIEAIPNIYEQLKQHIGADAIAINECVSDVDGQEVVFNISNNDAQSSSFLELDHHSVIHPTVFYTHQLNLRTKRLDTIVSEYSINLDGVKLLNLDIQGVELLALKGMGDLVNNFDYAIIEINKQSTYKGCALVGEIDEYLAVYGLHRVETGTWVSDTWTDGFYLRS